MKAQIFLRRTLAAAATLCLLLALTPCFASAQAPAAAPAHARDDISGDWQGTLQADRSLRTIYRITRTDKGFAAKMYSIDQNPQPVNVSAVAVSGSEIKLSVDMISGSFQGTLSPDGNTITGAWSQGRTIPLTLVRATRETAWEIPIPPPPPKPMAADFDPTFDVATVKPSNPDQQGRGFRVQGRKFSTINTPLSLLIQNSYKINGKQIIGAPAWAEDEKWDISAVPDGEGQPSNEQWNSMMRKLIVDRFKLTFHYEKKELPVFALTLAKGGPILTRNDNGVGLSLFFGPAGPTGGISLPARNASIAEFAGLLQQAVFDRPVVDQTGLSGRWDFVLKWAPDESQFGGHPPGGVQPDSPYPGLFTAIQQQIGLKLESTRLPVDVMVIDHIEKPTQN